MGPPPGRPDRSREVRTKAEGLFEGTGKHDRRVIRYPVRDRRAKLRDEAVPLRVVYSSAVRSLRQLVMGMGFPE
jgi:hypothetical protein